MFLFFEVSSLYKWTKKNVIFQMNCWLFLKTGIKAGVEKNLKETTTSSILYTFYLIYHVLRAFSCVYYIIQWLMKEGNTHTCNVTIPFKTKA